MELVQTAVQLQGVVPNEELLSLLPFIDDVDYAMDKLREEREELTESGYTMIPLRFISENFGAVVSYSNTGP